MTILIQWFILPLLSFLDILLTYIIVSSVRKKYHDNELNIITKFCWKRFGLKNGTILFGTFVIILLTFLSIYIFDNDMKLVITGFYAPIIYLHYSNLCTLYDERKKRNSKILLKKYVKK
jgi:hypothetical protein